MASILESHAFTLFTELSFQLYGRIRGLLILPIGRIRGLLIHPMGRIRGLLILPIGRLVAFITDGFVNYPFCFQYSPSWNALLRSLLGQGFLWLITPFWPR